MLTFLAFLVTLASVVAGFLLFLAVASASFYFGKVPSGSNAMGLVIPILAAGAAGVLTFIASIIAGGRGNLDYLGWTRGHGALILSASGLCVGFAMFGCLLAWCEKYYFSNPGLLLIAGFFLPLAFLSFITLTSWASPEEIRQSKFLQGLSYTAVASTVMGMFVVGLMLWSYARHQRQKNAALIESYQREEAERQRLAAMTPEERLLESLANYSPDAPLWTLTAGLPDEPNPSLRKIWIDRALQVPKLNDDLHGTIGCEYGNYRHGCVIMICEAPEGKVDRERWGKSLVQDVRLTTQTIRKQPDLERHDDDPLAEHVLHIAQAVSRVDKTSELDVALAELLKAVKEKPMDDKREACIRALEEIKANGL